VRIRIGSLGDVGAASRLTIWLRTVRRAGSLGHRHDIAIVSRLHLLKGKLKVSCKLTMFATVCCVMLRVWSLKNSVVMPAGNLVTSQRYCKDIAQCLAKPPAELKVSKLQYVNVTVNGSKAVALCDSGSQIPVVSSRLLNVSDDDKMGTVNLQGVVGEAVTVPLMSVSVKLSGDEQCEQVMEELQLLCAVVDLSSSNHDVILPVDVVDELRDMPAVEVVRMPVTVPRDVVFQVEAGDVADAVVADSTVQSNSDDDVCDADCLGLSDSVCGADELIAEQHSDAVLADLAAAAESE